MKNEQNAMREIKIEKLILNIGGTGDNLEKGFKLLGIISGRKPMKRKSKKRIPSFGIRPGMEVGCIVTIRKNPEELIDRLLQSRDRKMKKKSVAVNHLTFGIKEYIEVPGMEYQRDIGIIGLEATAVFVRKGRRIANRKLKKAHIPKRQDVSKEEIIKFMEQKFKVEFIGK